MTDLTINGYEDATEIGRGGMGIVYRARQVSIDREIAIKILAIPVDPEGELLRRFQSECAAMGRLSWHPNVVVVHDAGVTANGQPYIVMEHLPGGSLAARVKTEGPLPWRSALDAGARLANALEAAHRSGVIHQDIKPENVLLSHAGDPKLGDFGVAAVEGLTYARSGEVRTTVAYAAPEVIAGARPTVASDIYSLASSICMLITGQPPFATDDVPLPSLLMRIVNEEPSRLPDDVAPSSVADLLLGVLAKDPDDRPASAAEFERLLRDALAEPDEPEDSTDILSMPDLPQTSSTAGDRRLVVVLDDADDDPDITRTLPRLTER